MSKGMILELKGDEAIILTPEGDFQAIKRNKLRKWQVGEEVDIPQVHMPQISKKKKLFIPSIALAASVLLVFISLFAYPFIGGEQTAVAYVSVDINPSVEMSIDKHVRVISMTGINKAGEEIVLLMEAWSEQPLDQVTINLIMLARHQGYLADSQNILVSTSYVDDASEGKYTESIEAALQKAEKSVIATALVEKSSKSNSKPDNEKNPMSITSTEDQTKTTTAKNSEEESFQIHRVKTKKEDHSEAKEKGISPGKYSIYLEAVEQGIEIELEEVKGSSIAELAQRLNGIGTFFSNKPDKQDEIQGNKAGKAEPKKQEQLENKGAKNNQQQNDKAQQNKSDNNQGQKTEQKSQDNNKGTENSNKPENPGKSEESGTPEEPGSPQISVPSTNGEQGKKEKNTDKEENELEKFKRQLELLQTIPGIIREVPGFRHGEDNEEDHPGVGQGNNKGNIKGNNKGNSNSIKIGK